MQPAVMTSADDASPEGAEARGHGWGAHFVEAMAVGGVTLFLLPLSYLLRTTFGLDRSELAVSIVMFHAARLLNDPHFSVTYLLFYGDARARMRGRGVSSAQQARYVFAGVVVPLVLVTWGALALYLRSAQSIGWMVQLMFLLVGWHYAKQGFGVLTVLSARRGVRFTDRERTVLLSHCYAGWAFAWANPSGDAGHFVEKGVVYWGPAQPVWLEVATGAVWLATCVALLVTLVLKWRRERRLPGVPLVAFLITIWVWMIGSSFDPLVQYAIPALHSAQYLYFVWLMRRNAGVGREGPPSFGPPVGTQLAWLALSAIVLGWVILRGVPVLLDEMLGIGNPDAPLGATPIFATFAVVINVHHYFMDNVIWRRDNPETRFLLAPDPPAAT